VNRRDRRIVRAMSRAFCLILVAAGCAAPVDDDDSEGPTPEPRQGPDYVGGDECPSIEEGWTSIESAGESRDIQVLLPDDPAGAPVVFAYHWLGGDADQILDYMEFDELPDEGVIVVAPASSGLQFEWAFLSEPDGNIDLALFTDTLACLWQQYDVDLDRIYATGMSAGALWTTYLTMYEAEWLAATAPFSGGTTEDAFVAPVVPLPVLVTWGGPTDYAVGYNFDEASRDFSQLLRDSGSFVVECEHDDGHQVPSGAKDFAWRFFEDHPAGVDPEPYDDLPGAFPAYCRIP
jgi:predicted esterase